MSVTAGFGERLAQERRLKAARDRRDIGQNEVAQAIGASGPSVSRWESGLGVPSDKMMAKLADYFGVTPSWLRYGQLPREAEKADPFGDGSDMGIPLAPGTAFDDEDELPAKKRAAGGSSGKKKPKGRA